MTKETLSTLDLLKKIRRMPQVVLPKDVALIIAHTGLQKDWCVLDAGTGSGFLSIFLAGLVKKVVSYERRKDFTDNIKKQVKKLGIKNLKIFNKGCSTLNQALPNQLGKGWGSPTSTP